MTTTQTHTGRMEAQFRLWGAKLDDLVARTEEAGTEAKLDYRKSIDALKAQRRAAQARLDEFKTASGGKWEAFKVGLERARNELVVAFKSLSNAGTATQTSPDPVKGAWDQVRRRSARTTPSKMLKGSRTSSTNPSRRSPATAGTRSRRR